MYPNTMKGLLDLSNYEKNCADYEEIIKMFKELGSGKMSRRDVLNNLQTMIEHGLINKLETIIEDIEFYEECF